MMFGFAIVCYLFLGGIGGGLGSVASVASFAQSIHHPARRYADHRGVLVATCTVSALALLLAGLCLLADSGRFSSLGYLFFASKPSLLSVGAWLVVVEFALCGVLAYGHYTGVGLRYPAILVFISALGALCGAAVALYTGLFLASIPSVPLWDTPLVPALFLLSSFSCACAFVPAIAHALGFADDARRWDVMFSIADMVLVGIEAICVALLMAPLVAGAPDSVAGFSEQARLASLQELAGGSLSGFWWGGFAACGLAGSLVSEGMLLRLLLKGRTVNYAALVPLFCVLTGTFALRACLVGAGAHPGLGL